MNFRRILFGIIAISFILSNCMYFLNAMDLNEFKENAKILTVQGAKKTSKLAADFAQYLEGTPTQKHIEQAQEIITSPEAQETINSFNSYGEFFEEFTIDHPYFYLAAQGFVGVVLIGTALYLVYKTGSLHKTDTVLEFIKKNPEISAVTFLSLLNFSLYVASNLNPESAVSSIYKNVGSWQGIGFLTLTVGAGIKFYNWLTSGKEKTQQVYPALPSTKDSSTTPENAEDQKKLEKKEENTQQHYDLSSSTSSISSTSSSKESTPSSGNSSNSSSSTNLKEKKQQLVTNLENILGNKPSLTENALLLQVKDFNDQKLNELITTFFTELKSDDKKTSYGNAASKKFAIEQHLKNIKKLN
jgi:hypothetical protein